MMAGGTWSTMNKVRPGVYVNVESEPKPLGSIGDRGIATMPLALSWGEAKTVIPIEAGENVFKKLGYSIIDPEMLLIKEALKRAKVLLLYRLNNGSKAKAEIGKEDGKMTIKAKHSGIRGNDITVSIHKNLDDDTKYDVQTFLSGREVDIQTIAKTSDFQDNGWIEIEGSLIESAGIPLQGGLDGVVSNQDYMDYLEVIEKYDFNAMALTSTEAVLKGAFASFVKRMRDDEGKKIQCVMENYPLADHEGVISVKNGVILASGEIITAPQAVAWTAGATAGAGQNQSLTYKAYDDAVDAYPRYTNSEIIAALKNGEFIFTHNDGRAIVEQDINTFTSFEPKKDRTFSKNRAIRVFDGLATDYLRIFSQFYIGKIDNNAEGRNIFKNECINQSNLYQKINAIQNFDSQNDIVVEVGNDIDAIYIGQHIQVVDSVEKIYIDLISRKE